MDAIETFSHNTMAIQIHVDEDPENPRDWDNLGTMVCFHNRYRLGDKHSYKSAYEFKLWVTEHKEVLADVVALNLFLMDHSGLVMRTNSDAFKACDSQGWDWGQVGVIYVTYERIKKEFGSCDAEAIDNARAALVGEVETYSQYLAGEVYGYAITDEGGNTIESQWGIYGFENCKKEAMEAAERSPHSPLAPHVKQHIDDEKVQAELAFFN